MPSQPGRPGSSHCVPQSRAAGEMDSRRLEVRKALVAVPVLPVWCLLAPWSSLLSLTWKRPDFSKGSQGAESLYQTAKQRALQIPGKRDLARVKQLGLKIRADLEGSV